MNCNNDCSTCQTSCGPKCPVCGAAGMHVESITVAHMANNKVNLDDMYYLCINKKCNVAYFNDKDVTIPKQDVKVDIWFKENLNKYIICYCHNIKLSECFDAVKHIYKDKKDITKQDVISFLNKQDEPENCLLENPTGKSCDRLFENAIAAAINQIKNQ